MFFKLIVRAALSVNYLSSPEKSWSFWSLDSGWFFLAWSWTCHCWWMGKTKGALERSRRVEGERACERLEFMLNLMASDSLQVSPPILDCTRGGGSNNSGGLYDHRKDEKQGRKRGGKHVFSPGTPAAARQWFMLFSELWDLKMLHLIKHTERRANVKDVPCKALQFWSLYHTMGAVGMREQSDLQS